MRLGESRAVVCLGMGEAGQGTIKRHKETFWDCTSVHYLDCSDGLTGICICQNLSNHTL